MAQETQFSNWLRPKMKSANIFTERLTEKFRGGIPDIVYCAHTSIFPEIKDTSGVTGFLELKDTVYRKRSPPLIEIRPDQALWMANWTKNGGRAFILVRVQHLEDSKKYDYWLFRAHYESDWINMWPSVPPELIDKYRIMLGVGKINWEHFRELLTR